MDTLRGSGGETGVGVGAPEVAAVRAIVEEEFAAYVSAVRAASVTPTVVALRAKAATVVDAELTRLAGRLAEEGVSGHALEEMAQTVRRVVDKLLHAPDGPGQGTRVVARREPNTPPRCGYCSTSTRGRSRR